MLCPKCGKEISNNAKFCRFCGANVFEKAEVNAEKPLSVKPENDHVEMTIKPEQNTRKTWFIWAIILFVIAIIATAVTLNLLLYPMGDAADKKNVNMTTTPAAAEQTATADPAATEQTSVAGPSAAAQTATAAPSVAEQTMTVDQNEDGSKEQSVLTYDNGDAVYLPTQESIAYDETENVIYYNNLLVVYLLSGISQEDAEALAESVSGTVVGDISGAINVLQIKVDASDLAQLDAYAATLMESEDVLYATYDMPIPIAADAIADSDPWSSDPGTPETDRANEEAPAGNDWWAEAIGAYTAWNYVDSGVELAPVTVGVIDSGFDADHPEFAGRMTVQGSNVWDLDDAGKLNSHGMYVSGIIAAANNSEGIRGIADDAEIICSDWSVINENKESVNLLSTGYYIEITKQMYEQGARVINNSWGNHFKSENGLRIDIYKDKDSADKDANKDKDCDLVPEWFTLKLFGTYDKYVDCIKSISKRTGVQSILLILELMLDAQRNDRGDFMIIQGAGNGLDNHGPGIDARYSAFYCGVDKSLFEEFSALTPTIEETLSDAGITYETIKDHILIVGAVENDRVDGNYRMASYSNYGDTVDIYAPGGPLNDTNDELIYSTALGGGYGYSCGTSMATPMVSGAAALLWSIDPTLSAAKVREYLCEDAPHKAVRTGTEESHPMLNVGAAVEALLKEKSSSVKPTNDKVLLTVNAYNENDELVETVRFDYNENGQISRSYHDSYWNGRLSDGGYDYIYTYDTEGRLISRYYYVDMWDGGFEDITRSYDSNGLLISDNMYGEGEVSVEKEYVYDEGGQLIREYATNGSPALGGRVENEYTYSYYTDKQGNLVGILHDEKNPDAEDEELKYNAEGQIIQGYEEDAVGRKIHYTHEYIDDPYFLVEDTFETAISLSGKSESYGSRYAYILDSAGQEIESFWLGSPETVQMNYDEDGYLVSVETSDQSGLGGGRTVFVYGEPGEESEAPMPSTEAESPVESNIPDGAGEFNDHYYYVYEVDTIKSWDEAKAYCEAHGGYLATITSAEEDAFLYLYILSQGYSSALFGLTDQKETNVWTWTTGETFSYENWHRGEPNHEGGNEHYGMYYQRNPDGSWNDGNGKGGPFICEWGENEGQSLQKTDGMALAVTGNAVNIRSGPGTNYASLGKVNKGDKLFSIGKSDNWYQVEYGNGTGYIIEDYVTVGSGGFYTAVDSGTLSVNGNDVNIRSGPGTEYQSIGMVSRGTTLTITGKSDNWYQVSYNGGTGYIIEDYVIRN